MKNRKTLTKKAIEKMAEEIMSLLEKTGYANDTCFFFNGKRVSISAQFDKEYNMSFTRSIMENVSPFEYFEYANPDHILSMTFEGDFYDIVNYSGGKVLDRFNKILEKYGVFYELGNAWNLSVFPINEAMEIEFTSYYVKPKREPIYVYWENLDSYPDLKEIIEKWRKYQNAIGDKGSCVIGEGFHMTKNGQEYKLNSCSNFQGSLAWETNVDDIKKLLVEAGYENVWFDYGHMD